MLQQKSVIDVRVIIQKQIQSFFSKHSRSYSIWLLIFTLKVLSDSDLFSHWLEICKNNDAWTRVPSRMLWKICKCKIADWRKMHLEVVKMTTKDWFWVSESAIKYWQVWSRSYKWRLSRNARALRVRAYKNATKDQKLLLNKSFM